MTTDKVNPLAVMDRAAWVLFVFGGPSAHLELLQARAAVAELVEAATAVFNAPDVMFTVAGESEELASDLKPP